MVCWNDGLTICNVLLPNQDQYFLAKTNVYYSKRKNLTYLISKINKVLKNITVVTMISVAKDMACVG